MDTVKSYVTKYFADKMSVKNINYNEMINVAYIDDGILDSFGVVSMITDFEAKFGIKFSNDDFQSENFKTIGGVIANIESKL